MRNLFRYIYILFVVVTATAGLSSCQDDDLRGDVPYTEGEPITLSLSVSVPQMTVQSRANIEDNELYTVKNVWIGVFNANTGDMTSYGDDGEIGWKKIENVEVLGEHVLRAVALRTKTGLSRIVAVANLDNQGTLADLSRTGTLRDLLDGVRTWDDFLKVGVNTFSAETENVYLNEIDRPNTDNGIPMAGCYYESRDSDPGSPADWIEQGVKTVNIQEATKTDLANGAIHLRRTISHITFNIRYAGDIIAFEPVSFTLRNAPRYSRLYESDRSNIGDAATSDADAARYFAEATYPARLYIDEITPATADGDPRESNPGCTFDFWMADNRHTGIIDTRETDEAKKYNLREERHGSAEPQRSRFKSLVSSGDEFDPGNMASYVEIEANVTYKARKTVDELGNEKDENGNAVSGGSVVSRSGIVIYTVHMGYFGKDINDFNSYRNCEYTYNMQVNGIDDVRLEATADQLRNGVEGTVTDVQHEAITLDSHFQQFNVRFTKTELTSSSTDTDGFTRGFGFTLTTYDNYVAYTYTENSTFTAADYKYSDWVEISPTSNATTMAKYKPYAKDKTAEENLTDGRVLPLREFYNLLKEKGVSKFNINGEYYYFTIFIKEYTYEDGPDSNNWGREDKDVKWHRYVNQPDRKCFLRVRRKVSGDGQSVYARSLFSIEQRSIQTFYNNFSASGSVADAAFGIEHVNETEGLNLRSTASSWGSDASDVNGRHNTDLWINYMDKGRSWSKFVYTTDELVIPNVSALKTEARLQNGPPINSVETGWNPASGSYTTTGYAHVLKPQPYTTGSVRNYAYAYDPQKESSTKAHYIEAVNACMNRNRDENGNGVIDNAEVKWYVPASGKYLRAILGRNSLSSPIMPYKSISKLPEANNRLNTRYMLYSSDDKIIWAMEGLSTSVFDQSSGDKTRIPWQVRCIRNLGTNLTTIDNVEKVTRAYRHYTYSEAKDDAYGIFRMTYYDLNSVRSKKFTESGNGRVTTSYSNLSTSAIYDDATTLGDVNYMPMHAVTHSYNMVYNAFEYGALGSKDCKMNELVPGLIWNTANNPCYKAGTNWRLPNQKELAIMRNEGLFAKMKGTYALSCTYNFFTRKGEGTAHTHNGFRFESKDEILYPEHKIILSRQDGGTQSQEDTKSYTFSYRCVRDVEP